ncbi:hypothetical protein D6764_00470 [Candidatus Woesearchaeota archaeon]|nr:MAG: hypothetical protein D6764_00470 [Candidatus Woesearchaeota archaeon]
MRKKSNARIKYDPSTGLYLADGKSYSFSMQEENGKNLGIVYSVVLEDNETGQKVLRFYPFRYGKDSSGNYMIREQFETEDYDGQIVRPVMSEKLGPWEGTRGQNAFMAIVHYFWTGNAKEIVANPMNRKLYKHYSKLGFEEIPANKMIGNEGNKIYMRLNLEELTREYFKEFEDLSELYLA